jgi:hypothetical protein
LTKISQESLRREIAVISDQKTWRFFAEAKVVEETDSGEIFGDQPRGLETD